MSMILENLYVSGVEETYHNEVLKEKVTHMLNVASEIMIKDRVNHVYKKIGINDDDMNSDIRSILLDCITWIDDAIESGGVVCVHCLEGKSRSVCVCIAYLCIKQGWTFHDAVEWVKTQRPEIDIYPLYLRQLSMYINGY